MSAIYTYQPVQINMSAICLYKPVLYSLPMTAIHLQDRFSYTTKRHSHLAQASQPASLYIRLTTTIKRRQSITTSCSTSRGTRRLSRLSQTAGAQVGERDLALSMTTRQLRDGAGGYVGQRPRRLNAESKHLPLIDYPDSHSAVYCGG
eukprot:scaffold121136_cov19-Prasinocladus_malaysianus.AAC.4